MAQVRFRGGQVVFTPYNTVAFCAKYCLCEGLTGVPTPCTFPTDVFQPPCVVIRKFDFEVTGCGACVTTVLDGVLPLTLWFDDVDTFATDIADTWANSTGIRLYATVTLDTGTCEWVLTIQCKEGVTLYDVWIGRKGTEKTPRGTYIRTSGCDLTEQITVN